MGHTSCKAWPAALVVACSVLTTSCSAIRGAPDPVVSAEDEAINLKAYLTGDYLQKYSSRNDADRLGMTAVQWRDAVIAARLEIADRKFQNYKNDLHTETTSVNLALDLASLGVSGAAAVASVGASQALSAANTGLIGAGAAFSKDSLSQSALPALYAQMEADRTSALIRIRAGQALLDDTKYTLPKALSDLNAYERAATLEGASQSLTNAATNAINANKLALDQITGLTVVPNEVQIQKAAFAKYIFTLVTGDQKATLDKIVDTLNATLALNIPKDAVSKTEGKFILEAVDSFVSGPSAATSMANLVTAIKPVSGQPF
jgi:flavin-binding protein dodecin